MHWKLDCHRVLFCEAANLWLAFGICDLHNGVGDILSGQHKIYEATSDSAFRHDGLLGCIKALGNSRASDVLDTMKRVCTMIARDNHGNELTVPVLY